MAATLPQAVRLRLEQALGQWHQWQCQPPLPGAPHIERRLTTGHSNWSVLVAAAERRFVVRIDGTPPAANGIRRQSEWRALQAAHGAGLAPAPRYLNPDLGALVCDYLPPDATQAVNMRDLAQLLRRIHQLPARHQRLHLAERLARYETLLARHQPQQWQRLQPCGATVRRQLQLCVAQAQATVLCHNDLLHANRLYSGGRLYALDWEYAAMASPWHELAVITCGDDLQEAQQVVPRDRHEQAPAQVQAYVLLEIVRLLLERLDAVADRGGGIPGAILDSGNQVGELLGAPAGDVDVLLERSHWRRTKQIGQRIRHIVGVPQAPRISRNRTIGPSDSKRRDTLRCPFSNGAGAQRNQWPTGL